MEGRTLITVENETVKIRIRYHANIDRVEKISQGDWIDLRAAEDVEMKKGQFKMFSLGVSMELPKGYRERKDVEKFCRVVDFSEMQNNDFNLNIPRYVDTSEEVEPVCFLF